MTEPDPITLDYANAGKRGWASRGQRARGPVGEAVYQVAMAIGWAGIAWLAVAIALGVMYAVAGAVLVLPGVLTFVLFAALLASGARALRRRRAAAVLGYLDQAVRLNQPFDRLLAAAARGETGRLQRRLQDLYLAISGGMTLVDAVAAAVPEVPARTLGRLAYAESTGRLASALRRLGRGGDAGDAQRSEDHAFAVWYPPLVLMVVAGVVAVLSLFVMPKFQQIFADFRVPLPQLTLWLIDALNWALVLAIVMVAVVLVGAGGRLREAVEGERRSWLLQRGRDPLLWRLPVVGQPHRDRNHADLCDALADAVEQGFPLAVALDRAQRLDLNGVLLQRTSVWFGGLTQGLDAGEAARAARMPPLLTGMLTTATGADAAAALRFAARFYAARSAARRAVLASAYVPLVTLALGLIVGLVAVSLFLPIRDLIDHTEPYPVGL